METPPTPATAASPAPLVDDFIPTFYVGHHETSRKLPVTELKLHQSQEAGVC